MFVSFFKSFVRPNYQFGEAVHHVCKSPCFSDLTKAEKYRVGLEKVMVSFRASARLTSPSSTLRTDAVTQTETASFSPAASKTPPTIATYSEYEFDDSHSTLSEGTSAGELVDEVSYCKGEGDTIYLGEFFSQQSTTKKREPSWKRISVCSTPPSTLKVL